MIKDIDFLIVGGGIAGTCAAQTIRKASPNSSITIISDEPYRLYSRILLEKFIRGEIKKEQVFLKTTDWYSQNSIELILGVSAKKVTPKEHTLETSNGESYRYKKLLLALGARPIKLKVEGADLGNIFNMWTLSDAEKIREAVSGCQKPLIIGGGFIGLDFMRCFSKKNCGLTILDGCDYYWGNRLDKQSSGFLKKVIELNGVKIIEGEMIEKFMPSSGDPKNVGGLITKKGNQYDADLVGVGIGIKNDLDWLRGTGINITSGIKVNEFLETDVADIYSAGDCANYYDLVLETQHLSASWANSTIQGTIVGKTMSGQRTVFETVCSYTTAIFNVPCVFLGITDAGSWDRSIQRGSQDLGKLSQIFAKKYGQELRIVGAISINNSQDSVQIASLIKKKTNILPFVESLSDINFEIKV